MAYPFKPLSTEKLKICLKRIVDRNCGHQDTNSYRKKHSGKSPGNKLARSRIILKTWIQREIDS